MLAETRGNVPPMAPIPLLLATLAFVLPAMPEPDSIPLPLPAELPFTPAGRTLEGLVITIDAGHGGASFADGYAGSARGAATRSNEQDLNMLVTAHLFHHLQAAGAKVYMTRRDDRRMTLNPLDGPPTSRSDELGARVKVAAVSGSHLFLSLHHNWAERASASGVVILIWPTSKDGSAQPLETAFADVLRDEIEKGVPHAERFNHYVSQHPLVSFSDIPSAVIEFGFLSNPDFDRWTSARGAHRIEAVAAFRAVERFWRETRADLDAERARLFPAAAARAPDPPTDPFDAMLRLVWPSGEPPKTEAEAARFVEAYRRTVLADHTSFLVRATVERAGSGWRVSGVAGHPHLASALPTLLGRATGEPVENLMRVVPDATFGADCLAVVRVPMALTWGEPREGASVQTQLLLGETVFRLDRTEDGSYELVQGGDGYLGWVRRDALLPVDAHTWGAWAHGPVAVVTRDVILDDFRVPAGARLPLMERPTSGEVRVSLPAGVRATQGKPEATLPVDSVRLPSEPDPGRLAALAAAEYMGVPHLFGGRSRLGLDCSGLTGVAWAAAGVTLPRDANQQTQAGRLVGMRGHWSGLKPGDLLFFIDATGRLIHAGVSIGGSRFLHACPPEVQVSSLDPADPLYSKTWAEAFVQARRVAG